MPIEIMEKLKKHIAEAHNAGEMIVTEAQNKAMRIGDLPEFGLSKNEYTIPISRTKPSTNMKSIFEAIRDEIDLQSKPKPWNEAHKLYDFREMIKNKPKWWQFWK